MRCAGVGDCVSWVAFPLVGAPWPNPALFGGSGAEFVRVANLHKHEWIFHLGCRISPSQLATPSRGTAFGFPDLVARLNLPSALSLELREFLPEDFTRLDDYSDWAVPQSTNPVGHSFELAVAVAALAAFHGRTIGSDVLVSGTFAHRTGFALGPIGAVPEKAALALGVGGCQGAMERLTQLLYEHRGTERILGPAADRVLPGKVRFFVTSGDPNTPLPAFDEDYGLCFERLEGDHADSYRHEFAEGQLILVVVDHLARAAELVGLPETESIGSPQGHSAAFYRVRLAPNPGPRPRYWDARVKAMEQVFEEWATEAARQPGGGRKQQLSDLLTLVMAELSAHLPPGVNCYGGDVAIRGDNPDCLDVVAEFEAVGAPLRYPATLGISKRVLQTGQRELVPNTQVDHDFLEAISDQSPARQQLGEEGFRLYRTEFLGRLKACMKFPLHGASGKMCEGVLALHIDRAVPGFAPGLGDALERLIAQGKPAVAALREGYTRQTEAFPIIPFDYKPPKSQGDRESLLSDLGKQLIEWAFKNFQNSEGFYRCVFRVVAPQRDRLSLIDYRGFELEPPPEATPLDQKSAAAEAVHQGTSFWIEDTELHKLCHPDHGLIEIPPRAGAVAAVLLRVGGYPVGVLNLDWKSRRTFSEAFKAAVEEALFSAGVVLNGLLLDAEFNELEVLFKQEMELLVKDPTRKPTELFQKVLHRLRLFVGDHPTFGPSVPGSPRIGLYAMLFLRDPETGRYRAAAADGHSAGWENEPELQAGFAPGEAIIGWVAKHRRAIWLHDRRDQAELTAFDRHDRPKWQDLAYFAREFGPGKLAYLAVPVVAGKDVVAVIRLAHNGEQFRFQPYDKQIVQDAATRLGHHLYRQNEYELNASLWPIMLEGPPAEAPVSRAAEFFIEHLPRFIGPCEVSVRLFERVVEADGTERVALRRIACTEKLRDGPQDLLRTKADAGVSARVLRTRQHIVTGNALGDEEFLEKVQVNDEVRGRYLAFSSVAGYPLFGASKRFVGSLYVAREQTDAFSETETDRIQLIAHLLGRELAQRMQQERNRAATAIRKMLLDYLALEPHEVLYRHDKQGIRARIATQILRVACDYLGAERGEVLLIDKDERNYERAAGGYRTDSAESLRVALGSGPYRVVSFPERDRSFQTLDVFSREETSDRSCALLPIKPSRREYPTAVLWFVAKPNDIISLTRLKQLSGILGRLSPILQKLF